SRGTFEPTASPFGARCVSGAPRRAVSSRVHASCIAPFFAGEPQRLAMTHRPLRILIIDANAVRAAILEEGLREASGDAGGGYGEIAIHHVRDDAKLLPRIAQIDPDVILIDLENPSRDTLEQMFQVSRLARRPIAMFVDKS